MKRFKEKRVLVTGAYGYIGSGLVKKFKEEGTLYLAVDKVPLQDPKTLCFDLSDPGPTIECVKNFKPNLLIHLATHSALAYQHQFLNSFKEDSQILFHILEGLSKISECRLIYFSSSYVYSGLPQNSKVTEESLLKPVHPFGIAKAFFEQFILKTHPESVIFRLFSVFGPGNHLFPNAVHNMVKECKEAKKVTVWGEGKRKMQYVFLQDVLRYVGEGPFLKPDIYNLGGNEYLSTQEAAQRVAQIFDADLVFLRDKKEGETLPFSDNSKIKEACGKDFFTPFALALREYL